MTDHPSALVSVPVEPIQRLILAADSYGVRYLDSDHMTAEAQELQDATEAMKDLIAAPAAPQAAGVGELDWSRFKEMCEQKLATALKADFGDAPFPMDANEAASYHRTRADLLGWVLDMWPTTPLSLRAPSREPEGGAVERLLGYLAAYDEMPVSERRKRWPDYELESRHPTNLRLFQTWLAGAARAALATREEAPAGAGPVCLEIPLLNHMRVTLEYGPDGSRTATLWNEANEPIADGDAPSLRAQPQAREDAQPVAWAIRYAGDSDKAPLAQVTMSEEFAGVMKHQGHEVIALGPITHPAPDALRVAVEVLEKIKANPEANVLSVERWASQALAALQAEQKGGA
jgi:hypothetical protein